MNSTKAAAKDLDFVLQLCQFPGKIKPYRNIYLVTGDEALYVVKKLRVGAVKAYLTGELLSRPEFSSFLPCLIKPETGGYYFWHGGNRYFLTKKINGYEADYYSIADLQAAIKAMALFHRMAGELVAANPAHWSVIQYKPLPEWSRRLREMETCRDMAIRLKDTWSKQYLKVWYMFHEEACETITELSNATFTAHETICYHDWAYHNVLINRDGAFLIDFDDMLVDHPVHDRANLIGRYLRLHQWSTDSLLRILWNFDRFYHWKGREIKLLRIYLSFPFDYWILGRQYFIEKQPWSLKYYQDQWERKISHYKRRESLLNLLKALERE